jgi:hypothetical protein
MAEEILVKEQLTDKMIKAGKQLVKQLEATEIEVVAAFWLYTAETSEWQLILASPQVDTEGPRKVYSVIWDILHKGSKKVIDLDLIDIAVRGLHDRIVRALAGVNQLYDKPGLAGKRLKRSNFDGIYVEDIYIYFVKENIPLLPSTQLFSK